MPHIIMKCTSLTLLIIASFVVAKISCQSINTDGFLTINCGASANTTDNEDLLWISDKPFTRNRSTFTIADASISYFQYQTFAYFTNLGANKYCYLIPVKSGALYLVRAEFSHIAFKSDITLAQVFDLFINGVKWIKVNLTDLVGIGFRFAEIVLLAKTDNLSLCLARNSETEKTSHVFISAIKLRPLISALYNSTNFEKSALVFLNRINCGSSNLISYPVDVFDRYWVKDLPSTYLNVSTAVQTFGKGLQNEPPIAALKSAITTQQVGDLMLSYSTPTIYDGHDLYFAFYFCNIEETNLSAKITFEVSINDDRKKDLLEFTSFLQCMVVQRNSQFEAGISLLNIKLHPGEGSERGPFINAAEAFQVKDVQNMTHLGDVMAIRKIADSMNVPDDWFGGDPCLPAGYACTGIVCNEDSPSRVIILNLTNFGLTGKIPPIIAKLTSLTQLVLGNNNLSGSIPDFSSLKNLETLDLHNNQLTGRIPSSLANIPMLKELYLENNELDGTLPPGLQRPGLHIRGFTPPTNKGHQIKNWIVGCLVAASLIVVLLTTVLWRCIYTRRAHSKDNPAISPQEAHGDGHHRKYHRLAVEYTEEEIKAATNNYSTLIGKGGFGSVFSGTLSGYDVAVKLLSDASNQGEREFQNEVTLLCRIYHKNLVNLIGYCKLPVGALVYEYMHRGTLKDHLHGTAKLENPLDWNIRLKIALQAAEGLLYLHEGCNPPIIHRDIKCSNILLDGRMNAKVADFGLAKLFDNSKTHISTAVKGTIGYLDPEYYNLGSLTEKSDVYSFGVVMLEIISGIPPSENIVALARELLSCGRIADLMDSSLGGRYKLSTAWQVAEVAYTCVAPKTMDRPTMSTVVKELKEAVALEFEDSSHYEHIPDVAFHESESEIMPRAR